MIFINKKSIYIKNSCLGSTGESGPRRLVSNSRKCFQKGETDFFLLALPTSIGEINEAEIWHNNAGSSPGWFLLKVQVSKSKS